MQVKGDLSVLRLIEAGRRVNQGFIAETLSALKSLDLFSYYWSRLDASSTQDIVLPDATTLPLGAWQTVIDVPAASGASLNVKTYHAVTPVLLKNVIAGRAYEFTLVNNTTAAGVWQINFLEEADLIAAERYAQSFNNTTDWGSPSAGYYTITVTEATHGKGTSPRAAYSELSGSDYIDTYPDRSLANATGDISFRVPQTPDGRFTGKIVIM